MNSDLTCNIPGWEHFPWIIITIVVAIILMIWLFNSKKDEN